MATDIGALAALLRDDVRCSMPPAPDLHVGREAVVRDWVESGFESMTGLRAVPTAVNRQPAVAFYLRQGKEDAYLPLTVAVVRVTAVCRHTVRSRLKAGVHRSRCGEEWPP
ncbi:hypothetical protein ABT090_16715 [Streptomyces asoensis]|uniref:hypothetical protein n=1 Tax=Streptomyces asoensis TaxID=249586 RepID=UPI00331E58CB